MSNAEYYIGLMSGTSIDAMDAVLARFTNNSRNVVAKSSRSWSDDEKAQLNALCLRGEDELERAARASIFIAKAQAHCIHELLEHAHLQAHDIVAIGSHGQTVRHCPKQGFSIQLNNPALLATLCDIDVISDFRSRDLALGGEGAPLTPAFNSGFFQSPIEPRYILNLGGIANVTILDKGGKILAGFDTGPANTLLDLCARIFLNSACDFNALHATQGHVNKDLLDSYLAHPYFKRNPPKSTGRELFNASFIDNAIQAVKTQTLKIDDLLATLCELTVQTAVQAIKAQMHKLNLHQGTLILCGGGAKNPLLRKRFAELMAKDEVKVRDCSDFGATSDTLEALSFAWFAYLFIKGQKLELGLSTKATTSAIAGNLTPADHGWFCRNFRK